MTRTRTRLATHAPGAPDGRVGARRRAALALPAVGLVLALAACARGGTADTPADAQTAAGPQTQRIDDPGRVVGEIVALDAALLQVRATDEQTAVTWDDTTTFTQTVAGTLADVTVGSCVLAIAAPSADGDGDEASSDADEPLAATTVTITAADADGTCAGPGGAGGPGGPGGGAPGGMPTDLPTDLPSGGPPLDGERPDGAPTDLPSGGPQTRVLGGVVSGQVTAVSGETITVSVRSGDSAATDEPVDREVVVSAGTTVARTVDADASALAVGRCASVRGEADDSGKVAATSVQVSDPSDDGCSAGPGGMTLRGGPGGMPGGPGRDDTQGGEQDGGGSDA